jgi:hypothetical protein
MVQHRRLNPAVVDLDDHLDRLAPARAVQHRVGRDLVEGQDDVVGDLVLLAERRWARTARRSPASRDGEAGMDGCIAHPLPGTAWVYRRQGRS